MSGFDLMGLQSLLQSSDDTAAEQSASERARSAFANHAIGGGSSSKAITAGKVVVAGKEGNQAVAAAASKDIWTLDEVPTIYQAEDRLDPRQEPEYDILYKQDVMSEDIFLGMGDKTPGSQDCSHMVVKVHFPGCCMKDLDLEVTKEHLKAESAKFRLSLFLPLPVDDANGNAKWDSKRDTLVVTLPILRDTW